MQCFAVMYRSGPEWSDAALPTQDAAIRNHFVYLQSHVRADVAFHAPFRDRDGILAILVAGDLDSLTEDLRADPLVQAGVLVLEIHPMSAGYVGHGISL